MGRRNRKLPLQLMSYMRAAHIVKLTPIFSQLEGADSINGNLLSSTDLRVHIRLDSQVTAYGMGEHCTHCIANIVCVIRNQYGAMSLPVR